MSSRIMRVALNLEQLFQRPPGGVGRYAAELARVLPDVGAPGEVVVAPFVARHRPADVRSVCAARGLPPDPVVLGLPRPLLYELWNRWGVGDPLRGRSGARLGPVDVLHAPSVAVPPRGRVPLVVTVHDAAPLRFPDTYPARGRRFHELGFAAAARRADAIVAPSAAAADEIADLTTIARDRIVPIHHGVDQMPATDDDVARARAECGIGDDPYVLWVSTLEPRKDVGTLLDAFARAVVQGGRPHRLVLVGPRGWLDGDSEAGRRAATLGTRVTFTGTVDGARLRGLYRGADLFALPSRHEGFGMTVLEAMVQGTVVLASDIPPLREVGGDAAVYAPVGDVEAWAAALGEQLDDSDGRDARRAAGRARAEAFTWARCGEAHLALYRAVGAAG